MRNSSKKNFSFIDSKVDCKEPDDYSQNGPTLQNA
jgi:hypothetical protein